MVYVFIADGSEEIETVTPVDCLRRAGAGVKVVKVGAPGDLLITGSRGIKICADIHEAALNSDNLADLDLEMIVLPGGAAGVENLYVSKVVERVLAHCVANNIKIGAICAAPSILARRGYLRGKKATSYPSFRHYLAENGAFVPEMPEVPEAVLEEPPVITDGIFTTAWGMPVSIDFAFELVKILKGEEAAAAIGR